MLVRLFKERKIELVQIWNFNFQAKFGSELPGPERLKVNQNTVLVTYDLPLVGQIVHSSNFPLGWGLGLELAIRSGLVLVLGEVGPMHNLSD